MQKLKHGTDIPVLGREGSQGCEMSRIPHYADQFVHPHM
jgi:hypothetical protein